MKPCKNEKMANDILDYINKVFFEENYMPSMQNIADKFGIAKSTASRYVSYLKENKKLEFDGTNRKMKTKTMEKAIQKSKRAPIIGTIACGKPIFAEENIEGYVSLPEELLDNNEYFCLWAKGDSMIKTGISDGDLVICRKQSHANNGQIVVAICDDEDATLKRFYLDMEHRKVRLHPENDNMKDMYYDSVAIQGVAVKVIKNLERVHYY